MLRFGCLFSFGDEVAACPVEAAVLITAVAGGPAVLAGIEISVVGAGAVAGDS